jgi:hypothetical protein
LPLFFPIPRIDPQAARPLHEPLAQAGLPCRASGRWTERRITVIAGGPLDIEKEPGDWGGVRITAPASLSAQDAARLAVGALAYRLMDLVARESIRGRAWARPCRRSKGSMPAPRQSAGTTRRATWFTIP